MMTKDQRDMVNKLLGYEPAHAEDERLTDWELKFLSDIQGRQGNLSRCQAGTLGDIWGKVFRS